MVMCSTGICWNFCLAFQDRELTKSENDPAGKVTALLIDDTIDARVGYKTENISKVFDHTA